MRTGSAEDQNDLRYLSTQKIWRKWIRQFSLKLGVKHQGYTMIYIMVGKILFCFITTYHVWTKMMGNSLLLQDLGVQELLLLECRFYICLLLSQFLFILFGVGEVCFNIPFHSITRHFTVISLPSHILFHTMYPPFLWFYSSLVPFNSHTHSLCLKKISGIEA